MTSGGRNAPRPYLRPAPERGAEANVARRFWAVVQGHVWVTTSQRYTHLEVEALQEQVAELSAKGFRGG